MTGEELERLYMDIYDNGIPDYGYKEKFKRYVNNRLEGLEKENEELKTKYLQATDEGTSWAHLKSLEKEIAELKEGNKELQKLVQQREQRGLEVQEDLLKEKEGLEQENVKLKERLERAEEIIKDLLLMAKVEHLEERYESVDEAEQFLSEVKE